MMIAVSRSRSVILKRGENINYLPYVVDLNGAKRLNDWNIWNGPRCRHVELQKNVMAKLEELERAVTANDANIKTLFAAVRQLMAPPDRRNGKSDFW
jgi:hypothetical protein